MFQVPTLPVVVTDQRTMRIAGAAVMALAAAVFASPAAAGPITCLYQDESLCAGEGNTRVFDFRLEDPDRPYEIRLTFDQVNAAFEVTITDELLDQQALVEGGRLANFPGVVCLPVKDGIDTCVEFHVDAPAAGADTWLGFFDLAVFWLPDTNQNFPNGVTDQVRVLHNRGDTPGDAFDTDVTLPGSYITGCPGCDPAVASRDDNFQSFLVVHRSVPEPAATLLLAIGLAGLAYRLRKAR
jgi:hypothetical protein